MTRETLDQPDSYGQSVALASRLFRRAPSWYSRGVSDITLCGFVAIVLVACVAACGGTSSETPFPLEPDFGRMDGGGVATQPPPAPPQPKKQKSEQEDEGDEEAPPPSKKKSHH